MAVMAAQLPLPLREYQSYPSVVEVFPLSGIMHSKCNFLFAIIFEYRLLKHIIGFCGQIRGSEERPESESGD